ncbi:hypothetical protein GCM10010191_47090 [Actinomadura vinacea]|uniref:Uncharacterized protein n=1 Tax=Actinomadura vinacea TaxID=115336 RepID=A0ABN3JF25_9ACTN
MANLFEAPRLEVVETPHDLHYQLRDSSADTVLADVAPVAVGEGQTSSWFSRLMKKVPGRPERYRPMERHHIPRITFRVSDARNTTTFFVDRCDSLIGNPCIPQYAVVDATGDILGFYTNDHYQTLAMNPPTDAQGFITMQGRLHLRDRNQEIVSEIVQRAPATKPAIQRGWDPGDAAVRFVGPDGTVWAKIQGGELAVEFAPTTPQWIRALIITFLVAGKMNERLHVAFFTPGYVPPEPLAPTTVPYSGYGDVHSSYMRYQEEFIEWFKKEANKLARQAAAATDL